MIKAVYSFTDEHFTYLSIKGHAGYADAGQDIVSAAVSSIAFGLMNALDERGGCQIRENNNHIEIIIDKPDVKSDDYLELVLFQLKTIEESYSEFIKVERK